MLDLLALLPPPQARHAMVVHIPIALGLLGILPLVAAACTGFRSSSMRAVALACLLIASGGAALAARTGHEAARAVRVEQAPLSAREQAKLAKHERRGGIAWVWPLATAALLGVTFIPRPSARVIGGTLALAGSIGVAVWFVMIAHVGGRLVYEHGLGVPQRPAQMLHGTPDDDP